MMSGKKCLIVLLTVLLINVAGVSAQTGTVNQFGNLNYTTSWNRNGSYMIATQFTLEETVTVNSISTFMKDETPPSDCLYAIFSDLNNQPDKCLASTPKSPTHISFAWYTIALSAQITLPPGKYWLAEVDTGASVQKYVDTSKNALTVSSFLYDYSPFIVGRTLPKQFTQEVGELAIAASLGPVETGVPSLTQPSLSTETITPTDEVSIEELIFTIEGIIIAIVVIISLSLMIYRTKQKQ
ncbi:MAG: hypothetical protein NWF01_08520 [Candidatus Bathyarchaeota archaeon]|nr:hypothetical protein [Candidatus Bathyarchaeota archaeon]